MCLWGQWRNWFENQVIIVRSVDITNLNKLIDCTVNVFPTNSCRFDKKVLKVSKLLLTLLGCIHLQETFVWQDNTFSCPWVALQRVSQWHRWVCKKNPKNCYSVIISNAWGYEVYSETVKHSSASRGRHYTVSDTKSRNDIQLWELNLLVTEAPLPHSWIKVSWVRVQINKWRELHTYIVSINLSLCIYFSVTECCTAFNSLYHGDTDKQAFGTYGLALPCNAFSHYPFLSWHRAAGSVSLRSPRKSCELGVRDGEGHAESGVLDLAFQVLHLSHSPQAQVVWL